MKHPGTATSRGMNSGDGDFRIGLPLPMPKFRGGKVSQHNDGDPPGAVASKLEHINRLHKAMRSQAGSGEDIPKPAVVKKRSSDAGVVTERYGVGGKQKQRVNIGAAKEETK